MSSAEVLANPLEPDRRRRGGIGRQLLRAASWLTTPLLPEDYLGLIDPLWSTRELLGRVQAVHRETADAVTVLIRPGRGWPGHRAGQFLGVAVEIDGVRHWRSYSMSCPPRPDGCLSITVKAQPGGLVSTHLVHRTHPGRIVALSGPFGGFVLPEPAPERLLFLTAGSGITPVMAILRDLASRQPCPDTVLVHSAPTADAVIFGPQLRALTRAPLGLRLHERHTRTRNAAGRFDVDELPTLCPDWSTRSTWACGPSGLLDEIERYWQAAGGTAQLHVERFGLGHRSEAVTAGQVHFRRSGRVVDAAADTPLAQVAAQEGVTVPAGCRIGMCGSCVARLDAGTVRDLHTGQLEAARGQLIRTCVRAAEGTVEIDL